MIISHKHKFIYLKCRKTAGTSVEMSLSKICGPHDIITSFNDKDEEKRLALGIRSAQNYRLTRKESQIKNVWNRWKARVLKRTVNIQEETLIRNFYNHISAEEVAAALPEVWNSYFKFTVERDPYDKVVSYYYWRGGHEKYMSVSEFILAGGIDAMKSFDLYSIAGVPAVDEIYRFEDFAFLEKDLTKRLSLDRPFKIIDYKAKSGYRKVRNYREILDDRAVELISKKFSRELELLGYEYQ